MIKKLLWVNYVQLHAASVIPHCVRNLDRIHRWILKEENAGDFMCKAMFMILSNGWDGYVKFDTLHQVLSI